MTGLPHIPLSQQFPLAFFFLVVWFFIIACAIHGPWPMSGPGLVDSMDLPDCPPPVEVDLAQEHGSFLFLVADESLLLPAKIFVPRPDPDIREVPLCVPGGALGGRIPRFASEAIRDFRL